MSNEHGVKTLGKVGSGDSASLHLAIWGLAEKSSVPAALEEILAARESRGLRVPVVTLLMRHRKDGKWVERAVRWLSARGRRVVVRTRVVLPRELVNALVDAHGLEGAGAVVELELAHHKLSVQRALLGPQAESPSALLLQAQHLETLELPVVARLAPLMPGIHDQGNGFMPLLRTVAAADLDRVVLEVGRLHGAQVTKIVEVSRELSAAGLLELGRAYAVDAMVLLGAAPLPEEQRESVFRLRPRRTRALLHGLESLAREAGLEVVREGGADGDGLAYAGLARRGGAEAIAAGYESVMGRDLFEGLEL